MKLVHVVQHTSAEFLGLVEDHLEGRGIRFRYHRPFTQKAALPKPDVVCDGLILLPGGPWGSAGSRDLPALESEIELVRACLAAGTPVIGFGLGAQILALAAGGRSESTALEFDITTVTRVRDDALNGYLPAQFPLAVYMRDFPLPPDSADVLAHDARGRPALWQVGRNALGFSGHPGLKLAMVEDLIMEFEEAPENASADLPKLRAAQNAIENALVPIMTGVVGLAGWMDDAAQNSARAGATTGT